LNLNPPQLKNRPLSGYTLIFAGIAQLVERNLAKVEVESSSLFSRSKKVKLL
jgi:hypothetical protein